MCGGFTVTLEKASEHHYHLVFMPKLGKHLSKDYMKNMFITKANKFAVLSILKIQSGVSVLLF